jgi:hypothetical protein
LLANNHDIELTAYKYDKHGQLPLWPEDLEETNVGGSDLAKNGIREKLPVGNQTETKEGRQRGHILHTQLLCI